MLTVEAMRNQLTSWIKLVDDPVCVFLNTCSEYDNLIELGHLAQEVMAEGSDQKVRFSAFAIIDIMDECLVEVEHKRVLAIDRHGG